MKSLLLSLFLSLALVSLALGNLIPLLQNPPITYESPNTGIVNGSIRDQVRQRVIAAIKNGEQVSAAIELKNVNSPYEFYAGYRNIEAQDPINKDTLFRLASLSKMVTAVTVLQYADKNLISLNDPVSKYIKSFASATVLKPVTPTVYPFASVTTTLNSNLLTISLPSLSNSLLSSLQYKSAGIRLQAPLNVVRVEKIYKIISYSLSAKTVKVDLGCPATASGTFAVNGTLDVLPALPSLCSPYDWADVSFDPVNIFSFATVRQYYTTEPSNTVTIRHLVTHTAGIGYGTPGFFFGLTPLQTAVMKKIEPLLLRWTLTPTHEMDAVEWAERFGRVPMMYQPGTSWTYGPQLGIAGAALIAYERSQCCTDANIGLYEIQKKILFDPLNITDAGYFIHNNDPRRAEKISKLAHVYTNADTFVLQTPMVVTPYVSLYVALQEALLPGLHANLMDGANPSGEGAANPYHPIYGVHAAKRLEAGDAGLYMRTDEYQRIVTMLVQNGTYNGVQILKPATVQAMVTNQIGSLFILHQQWLTGGVKWGLGGAVGNGSVNPDPLSTRSIHWSSAVGCWWFADQPSATAFTLNSNTLPGNLMAMVSSVANATSV